ncbi:hypothetical protein COO91_07957 [Nostoc flagelliforme CCNUN1]|uniref:Uncharacterized protein n=1 Tax=Nostoc flagelliforme CCNUN1 TaxID=2038116 RepID=A0A2K8T2H3_9NOSO|nr:hypothetical protein COO91_07957 [Nostoc flagelliforme CCNUN1]
MSWGIGHWALGIEKRQRGKFFSLAPYSLLPTPYSLLPASSPIPQDCTNFAQTIRQGKY